MSRCVKTIPMQRLADKKLREKMQTIVRGSDWIRIDEDRIQIKAIARYQVQVASKELKFYLLSGEIFKIALTNEAAKNQILGILDDLCGLVG